MFIPLDLVDAGRGSIVYGKVVFVESPTPRQLQCSGFAVTAPATTGITFLPPVLVLSLIDISEPTRPY